MLYCIQGRVQHITEYFDSLYALWLYMCIMASQIAGTKLFVQQLVQANMKVNIKVPHYWPFVRGTCQWWVDPLTKDSCAVVVCTSNSSDTIARNNEIAVEYYFQKNWNSGEKASVK